MFENLPSKSKKKDSDKVLTRLILILQKLSNNELPTRKELMEEFNVSAKTIQRDLNERLIYFPIEETSLKQLKFIDGFSLNKSSLSEDEMLFVYLSLSQIKDINKSFEKKTFEIFSKLLSPTFSSPYYIKPKSFENIDMDSKLLNDIERAIEYKNRLELVLNNTKVNIEPYRIVSFDGIWYLFGKELENEKIKTYFIHQIQKINILKEKYTLNKPIHEILNNVHSAWFEDGNQFDVEVKVNSCVAYNFKLKEVLPSQKILEEYENGDLLIRFKVSTEEDIDNIIKAWIPDIKIVSPKFYKEKFVNEVKNYIALYK